MQCSNGISMINSIQMVALTSTNHLYANLMNLPFVHFLIRLPYHFACVLPTIVLQVGVTTKSMYAVVVRAGAGVRECGRFSPGVRAAFAGWHQTAVRALVIDESIDSSWLGSVREKDAGGRLIG